MKKVIGKLRTNAIEDVSEMPSEMSRRCVGEVSLHVIGDASVHSRLRRCVPTCHRRCVPTCHRICVPRDIGEVSLETSDMCP